MEENLIPMVSSYAITTSSNIDSTKKNKVWKKVPGVIKVPGVSGECIYLVQLACFDNFANKASTKT